MWLQGEILSFFLHLTGVLGKESKVICKFDIAELCQQCPLYTIVPAWRGSLHNPVSNQERERERIGDSKHPWQIPILTSKLSDVWLAREPYMYCLGMYNESGKRASRNLHSASVSSTVTQCC